MPVYYFNVQDGTALPDSEGTELLNWQEARIESIQYIGQLLQDDARRIRMDHGWHKEVTDNSGLVLFRLDINPMNTDATLSERPRPIRTDETGRLRAPLVRSCDVIRHAIAHAGAPVIMLNNGDPGAAQAPGAATVLKQDAN